MSLPPRPASAVLLLAGIALLLPAPAAGQDLDELVQGIRRFRELQERFEEYDDVRDRERDRERRDQPGVNPNAPGPGGPPGLYGPNGQRGPDPQSGPPYGYGPEAPAGYRGFESPYDGRDRGGRDSLPFQPYNPVAEGRMPEYTTYSGANPLGTADAGEYLIRNPELRPTGYRVDGLPGGPIVIRAVDERAGRDPGRDEVRAAAELGDAQAAARRTLDAMADTFRDLRYGLQRSSVEVPGGAQRARALADQFGVAYARGEQLAKALRPEFAAFIPASDLDGIGDFGAAPRLDESGAVLVAGWSDRAFSRAEAEYREFENLLASLIEPLATSGPYLELRAEEVGRQRLALSVSMERLRAARRRLRQPGEPLWFGASIDRPVGGEDRLRLYALAARLTERTADLRDAAAADPVLTTAVDGRFAPPAAEAARVDAAARLLAAALATGANGQAVSAADVEFERAWSAWRGATGRTGTPAGVQWAAAAVDEVHGALHAAVPAPPVGGNGGERLAPSRAAAALAQSSAAFARQAPQLDPRSLRGIGRQEFLAAANGLSAAAAYYSAVVRSSQVGSDAERRARSVLDAAGNEAVPGLRELSGGGRRDGVAGLAQSVLVDFSNWRTAIR